MDTLINLLFIEKAISILLILIFLIIGIAKKIKRDNEAKKVSKHGGLFVVKDSQDVQRVFRIIRESSKKNKG